MFRLEDISPVEAEPGYLSQLLKAMADSDPRRARLPPEKMGELEILLPPIEEQRCILTALVAIEKKTALLDTQNRLLHEMARALFDAYFIYGAGKFRPLGDFVNAAARDAKDSAAEEGTGFYNLVLHVRDAVHPLFISLLLTNPEFLAFAKIRHGLGKHRLNEEQLMAFEISGPTARQIREFNRFAQYAEKKLAANQRETALLEKLREKFFAGV
jgi:restriction endonuclease S subunit